MALTAPAAAAAAADACVGIVANPVSARDIRRIVTHAGNLQVAERVSIVLRLLTTLRALDVRRVLLMPDRAGMRAMLLRHLQRERSAQALPEVEFLPMEPTSTVEDTHEAVRLLRAARVRAIVVLGGDGTHRAVVRECGDIPIAGLSTGTNNAFPELREPTTAALAVGLYATGRIGAAQALSPNKLLEVSVDGGARRDIALVDAVVSAERCIGARAVWKTEHLHSAYFAFAEPQAIGLSSIGALLQPVGRQEPHGLAVALDEDPATRRLTLRAPIAPGLLCDVGIAGWEPMPVGRPFDVALDAGVLALDGERELSFEPGEHVRLTLRANAFTTVDVVGCLRHAAHAGLLVHRP